MTATVSNAEGTTALTWPLLSRRRDMSDYTCPGLTMTQPADAPDEGYVACYRAGHECPPPVAITTADDTHRTTTLRCPCCGDFHGSMCVPLEWGAAT